MSNCKYLKQKLNKKLECKLNNKIITLKDCKNCKCKEYDFPDVGKMKSKSNKLAKLEKNRFSLFSDDTTKCFICGSNYKLTWHEIFGGRNRSNSIKYGLCLRLCLACHVRYQDDIKFNKEWRVKGQKKFNDVYQDLDFIEIFKRNWL